MKILAIEHNKKNLLLVDGKTVINGGYELIEHRDGSFGNHVNSMKAYFVMEVPPHWIAKKRDYNTILSRAEKHLNE